MQKTYSENATPLVARHSASGNLELTFWSRGTKTHLSGEEFWSLIARYVDFIEREPAIGRFVLIISPTSPDMMALFLAMIACRRLVSFFPPNSPIQDEKHYFDQQRVSLTKIDPASILTFEPGVLDTIRKIDSKLSERVTWVPRLSEDQPSDIGARGRHGQDLFFRALNETEGPLFVQHSSGTTGIKKAVGITGPALLAQYASYWPKIRQAAGGHVRIASWLPLYHDMGLLATFLLPILGGDSISIVDPFEWINAPGSLLEMIEHDGCNVCWLPNFAFRHLVRLRPALPKRRLGSMRLWVNCSEPCRYLDAVGFESAFREWGVAERSVVGCYAMAETVFAVSQMDRTERRVLQVSRSVTVGQDLKATGAQVTVEVMSPSRPDCALVLSSGRLIAGIETAIFVDGAAVAEEGIYGEIGIRGRFVFKGYRNLGEVESNIRPDGFFLTGDLGTIIDGYLYVFGRIKEIIIVNGKNIFAGDIEDVVSSVRGIKKGRVVAFGIESEQTGSEELVIVAEKDKQVDVQAATLRTAINRLVMDVFLVHPRDIRVVDERWLVKSTSGKISRQDNRARYLDTFRR